MSGHHPIFKVKAVKVVGPYKLELVFDDHAVKIIDFSPVLHGEIYSPLKDLKLFNQVKLDPEVLTIVWQNGADFDPATLHNWEESVEELSRRAKQWDLLES